MNSDALSLFSHFLKPCRAPPLLSSGFWEFLTPPCGAMALLILFVLNLPPPATVCVGKDKAVGSIVYIFQATTITDFSLSPSLQLSSLEAEGSGPPRCSSSRGYPLSLITHNPNPHCFQVYFVLTAFRRPELHLVYKTQSHGYLSSGDLLLREVLRETNSSQFFRVPDLRLI